jgi:hypothetical protein
MVNVNIANKLDGASKGTTLYSPIFGTVIFQYLDGDDIIVETHSMNLERFDKYGRYDKRGKQLLFPNEQTDDWSNYQLPHYEFKKGDILYLENEDCVVIFDHERDKSSFEGKHYYHFTHADYTSEIVCFYSNNYKLASETDIERYKKALKASGKGVLNSNTGELYPSFKPFDKVVVRDECTWHIDFFERYLPGNDTFPYECMHQSWKHCLPFNEETAKLIGTKDDYVASCYSTIKH